MRRIAFLPSRFFSTVRITRVLKPYVPEPLHPHYRKLRELVARWISSPKSYQDRIQAELVQYSETANVHELPRILSYWFDKHVVPVIQTFGFGNSIEMFRTYIARVCSERPEEICRILSIGAGDSATEINIAQWLIEQNI